MNINIVEHFIRWRSTLSSISSDEDQHCRTFHPMNIDIVEHFIQWKSTLSNVSCNSINIVGRFVRWRSRWTTLLRTSCDQACRISGITKENVKRKGSTSKSLENLIIALFSDNVSWIQWEHIYIVHQEHLWYKDFYLLSKIRISQIVDGHWFMVNKMVPSIFIYVRAWYCCNWFHVMK